MDSLKMDITYLKVFAKFAILSISISIIIFVMFANIRENLNKFDTEEAKLRSGSMDKSGTHLDGIHLGRGKVKRADTTPGDPLPFSAEEQQNLLDLHNNYRRQVSPEASNMEFMTWDTQLEEWAQEWTDACYYEHGFPAAAHNERVGQNLWRGFVAVQPDGTGPINSWWNEWQWYDYETNTCQDGKICGHYTQLTWDTSSLVGCGRSFCAEGYDDTLNFTDNYIVACNYQEQGNVVNIKPYETGTSCTRCASGVMTCDDKLCRQCQAGDTAAECSTTCEANCQNCATLNADCTCTCQPQFTGVDCSVACGNYDGNCGTGWPAFVCGGAFPGLEFVDERCPALCGLCTPDDGSFVCDSRRLVTFIIIVAIDGIGAFPTAALSQMDGAEFNAFRRQLNVLIFQIAGVPQSRGRIIINGIRSGSIAVDMNIDIFGDTPVEAETIFDSVVNSSFSNFQNPVDVSSGGNLFRLSTFQNSVPSSCDNYCMNGGTCFVTALSMQTCTCPLGATGDLCENDVAVQSSLSEKVIVEIIVGITGGLLIILIFFIILCGCVMLMRQRNQAMGQREFMQRNIMLMKPRSSCRWAMEQDSRLNHLNKEFSLPYIGPDTVLDCNRRGSPKNQSKSDVRLG